MVKVAFRRARFETDDKRSALFCENGEQESDMQILPFPVKASDLPYGARVQIVVATVAVVPENNNNNNDADNGFEARSWCLVGEHPRTIALREASTNQNGAGISCTKYLQARGNLFSSLQQQHTEPRASGARKDSSKLSREFLSGVKHQQGQSGALQSTGDKTAEPDHHGAGAGRAKIFAQWLVQNLPLLQNNHKGGHEDEPLSTPTLLDVAGGKGQLSVELAQLGVLCTVVDPLIRSKRSLRKLEKSRKRLSQPQNGNIPSFVAAYFEENQVMDDMVTRFDGLVGFHPDECTETIVDMALKHNKPFAVVPCCVFPSLFPMRTIENGKQVHSYDDFLTYLLEKDERLRRAELPMEGRNQVIFLANA